MYKTHNRRTRIYALASPENVANTVTMVSASIMQPWYSVGRQLKDIQANGEKATSLNWGIKKACYKYVQENKRDIFLTLHEYKSGEIDLPDLLIRLCEIPGIQLVKAGFIAQLTLGKVGCLDIHNLRMYGINASTFKFTDTTTYATKRKKAELYIATCERLGGSEYLWDAWCENLAECHPTKFTSKHHVSRVHCDYLGA